MGGPQSETGVKVILPFCEPSETSGLLKKESKQPSEDDPHVTASVALSAEEEEDCDWFNCPEEGCVKAFKTNRNLQRHIDFRRHQLNFMKSHSTTKFDANGPSIVSL